MSAAPPPSANSPSWPSPSWRALLVAVFFLAIGASIWSMNRSGLTWRLLEGRLANHPAHQIEAALFAQRFSSAHAVCVMMGDGRFQQRVGEHLEDAAPWLAVPMPRFSFRQLQRVLGEIPPGRLKLLVIQNHPAYWSNYRMQDSGMQTELWSRLDSPWPGPFPLADVKAFFQALRDWAQAPGGPPLDSERLANLDELRFQPSRGERDELGRSIAAHDARRVLWVEDPEGVHYETNPALIAAFREHLGSPAAAALGHYMEISMPSLTSELARCKNPASTS